MKKISVILPVYNAEKYVRATVESLFAQTYAELEIIAVDDGSSDSTPEILKDLAIADNRLKILSLSNGGAASARNSALAIADGDYVGFIDSDDIATPQLYERLVAAIETSNADMAQCAFLIEDGDKRETAYAYDGAIDDPKSNKKALTMTAPAVWCKLYRREIIGDTRFDTRYRIGEDMLFNLEILAKSKRIAMISDPLYRYIQREGSVCASIPDKDTILSYRKMTDTALTNFKDEPKLCRLIRSLRLLDGGGIASKTIRFSPEGGEDLFSEIVRETVRSLFFILFSAYLPTGERLKLCYIALFPKRYAKQVIKKHGGQK